MNLSLLSISDLKDNEHLVTVVRHHWLVLVFHIVGLGFVFIIPFIAVPVLGAVVSQSGLDVAQIGAMAGFLGSLWALIIWQFLWVRWTDWYFDVWIVTNWRIIDIDQKGLFRRNTATILDLNHIQDIDTELNGILGNLFDFGSIEVQSAGTKTEFSFEDARNPVRVERLIREAQTNMHQQNKEGAHA
ncbi:MAG: hypothetical protein RLZZ283_420 [Candidatus Parcubacteria bacterium]|jgi:hypothetical protein